MGMANFNDFGLLVVLHELGHTLGFGHNNTPINSFMQDPIPDTASINLHALEISWILSNI